MAPKLTYEELEQRVEALERKTAQQAQQEKKLRLLSLAVEQSSESIAIANLDGNLEYVNNAFSEMHGYCAEELIGKHLSIFHTAEQMPFVEAANLELRQTGSFKGELRHVRRDGDIFPSMMHNSLIRDEKNNPIGMVGTLRDISGMKQVEKALQEREEKYRSLFDNALVGLFRTRIFDGKLIELNHRYAELAGYSTIEECFKNFIVSESYVDPNVRKQIIQDLKEHGKVRDYEAEIKRRDGTKFWVSFSAQIYPELDYLEGVLVDINHRKQAEKALRKSEEKYRLLVDNLPAVVYRGYKDWSVEFIDNKIGFLIGYTKDEFDTRKVKWNQLIVDEDIPSAKKAYIKASKSGRSYVREYRIRTKTGNNVWIQDRGQIIRNKKGKIQHVAGAFFDITEQRRAEEALKVSEKRYRAVVEDMPAMICRFLPDGTLTFVNNAYDSYFGKKQAELIGRNFFQFIPQEDRDKVRNHFSSLNREMPMITYEHQVIAPDGAIRWQEWTNRVLFDEKGRIVEYQSIGRDITENRLAQQEKAKIEKQLQQAQKMESIGTLAGGIAHDFNNILSAIIGYTDLALEETAESDPVHFNLKQVLDAGHRAKDLVKQILAFSRQGKQEPRPVMVSLIIKEVAKLLRATLPATIEIHTDLLSQSDFVLADATQIHQILMNLCINAGHAMRETGGILHISLTEVDFDVHSISDNPDLSPGAYLRLDIADSGHGMSAEVMERIFDPFFTTKERGEGTGMGLAVVHGIVKSYGGAINVSSEFGQGTTFKVFLPRLEAAPEPKRKEEAPIPKGKGRVLWVDDEAIQVNMGLMMLERLGYEVVTRTSSLEALEAFRAQPDSFDLVITDQTMPNLTGVGLAKELIQIRPDMPIILCTGFSEQTSPEKAVAMGIREFLLKPIIRRELAEAVRRALDQ